MFILFFCPRIQNGLRIKVHNSLNNQVANANRMMESGKVKTRTGVTFGGREKDRSRDEDGSDENIEEGKDDNKEKVEGDRDENEHVNNDHNK